MNDKVLHKATKNELYDLNERLVRVQQDLHALGLHVTARAVNKSIQAIGWEFSGDLTKASEYA